MIKDNHHNKEPEIDVEYLQRFLEELQKDFAGRNLSYLNAEQAKIVASMPKRIAEYLKIITQIKKEKAEEKEIKYPKEKLEKAKKIEEKLAKLSKEIFITACASTRPIKEVLEFHERCNLGVKGLNEFGESGLNPLTAAMAGGRSFDDMGKILDKGADINFKSPQGNNAAHFAVMLGLDARMMEFLIKCGVDINAKNFIGLTPRDMARLNKNETLDNFLEKKGGELNVLAAAAEKEGAPKKQRSNQERKGQSPDNVDESKAQKKSTEREKIEREQKELKIQESQKSSIRRAIELAQVRIAIELAQARIELDRARKRAREIAEQEAEALRQAEELASRQAQELTLKQEQEAAALKQLQDEQLQAIIADQSLEVVKQEQEQQQLKIQQIQPQHEQIFEQDLKEKGSKHKSSEREVLEKILGVNLDEVNIDALLFKAVQGGQSLVAKYLIMSGANVNYSEGNCTVFEMAARGGNNDLIGFVAERANPETLKLVLMSNVEVTRSVRDIVEKALHSKDQQALSTVEAGDKSPNPKEALSSNVTELATKHGESKVSLERDVVAGVASSAKEAAVLIGGVVLDVILAPEQKKESQTSKVLGLETSVVSFASAAKEDVALIDSVASSTILAPRQAKESQTSPNSRVNTTFVINKGGFADARPNTQCSKSAVINLLLPQGRFQVASKNG